MFQSVSQVAVENKADGALDAWMPMMALHSEFTALTHISVRHEYC